MVMRMETPAPSSPSVVAGSFRDPSGRVFLWRGHVYRTITDHALADFVSARDSGLIARLVAAGKLIESTECEAGSVSLPPEVADQARVVIEHARIPFVSYPYEWPFEALKSAALLHLDVHLEALAAGHSLSDSSAFNVQFVGTRPVFIDLLSIRRYVDGEFWLGHRQFCEQFLNPLLLQAYVGTGYNDWYRGRMAGIPATDLSRLMPWWRKLGLKTLMHVGLQSRAQRSASRESLKMADRRLPRRALLGMLQSLRSWIVGLTPLDRAKTTWSDYPEQSGYDTAQESFKRSVVEKFVAANPPDLLFDLGCNTGVFSRAAIQAGAGYVVGLDSDAGALSRAFHYARSQNLPFLPLYADLANPSPSQGWHQNERSGLAERGAADAALALALVHHLAIGNNIPLDGIVSWFARLASRILVEFVPRTDPMVQLMLATRADIFAGYSVEAFRAALSAHGRVVAEIPIPGSGRILFDVDFGGRGPNGGAV